MNWRSVEEAGVGQLLRPSADSEASGQFSKAAGSPFLRGSLQGSISAPQKGFDKGAVRVLCVGSSVEVGSLFLRGSFKGTMRVQGLRATMWVVL